MRIGDVVLDAVPGRVWKMTELGERTIALDGAVQGPVIDPSTRRYSFDHHDGCIRLVTSATCRQVLDALALGLDPAGHRVLVNDLDADTATAVALLAHPGWAGNLFVRRLVEVVATADAHGPAYPCMDAVLAGHVAAAVAPAIAEWGTAGADPAGAFRTAVERIAGLVAAGTAGALEPLPSPPSPTVTVTHEGHGWVMATGEDVLAGLYAAGHLRGVGWRACPDGSWAYTVARRSDLVGGFPVGPPSEPGSILAALACAEPGWGGGSSVGGAPRHLDGRRSLLPPDDVFVIIESVVTS